MDGEEGEGEGEGEGRDEEEWEEEREEKGRREADLDLVPLLSEEEFLRSDINELIRRFLEVKVFVNRPLIVTFIGQRSNFDSRVWIIILEGCAEILHLILDEAQQRGYLRKRRWREVEGGGGRRREEEKEEGGGCRGGR